MMAERDKGNHDCSLGATEHLLTCKGFSPLPVHLTYMPSLPRAIRGSRLGGNVPKWHKVSTAERGGGPLVSIC